MSIKIDYKANPFYLDDKAIKLVVHEVYDIDENSPYYVPKGKRLLVF